MSLRFAIIKHIKTAVGNEWEDIVFEYQEDRVYDELLSNFANALPAQKWYKKNYTSDEVAHAFEEAWSKTVNDFKKVTVTIF
jgi:hypothetical protein